MTNELMLLIDNDRALLADAIAIAKGSDSPTEVGNAIMEQFDEEANVIVDNGSKDAYTRAVGWFLMIALDRVNVTELGRHYIAKAGEQ